MSCLQQFQAKVNGESTHPGQIKGLEFKQTSGHAKCNDQALGIYTIDGGRERG